MLNIFSVPQYPTPAGLWSNSLKTLVHCDTSVSERGKETLVVKLLLLHVQQTNFYILVEQLES